jgi:pantoate--beta-alanine ligase
VTLSLYDRCADLKTFLDKVRGGGQQVGMVGTSGAMHEGHLSLIRRAAEENDVTALFWGGRSASEWMASQVGPGGDDAARDFSLAESAGLDIVFAPESGELFPSEPMTRVSLPAMSSEVPHLESPAHLDLIAMTMGKLWHIFGPCRCYFGEKDWQQLAMFRRLATDLAWPVEVIGCPTIRDERGLALSSRNQQLSEAQRGEAHVLYRALLAARRAAVDGTRSTRELSAIFAETVGSAARIRYFTAVTSATMKPLDEVTGSVRLLASIEIGAVRLVDNIGIELSE